MVISGLEFPRQSILRIANPASAVSAELGVPPRIRLANSFSNDP
jgi:hypothetical protein